MEFFPDLRTILSIGAFELRWYPVLLISGGLFIYWQSARNLKKAGLGIEVADDLFIGCTIFAVIGARLWFCAFYDLGYYLSNPIKIFYTWEGGLAIQGAILGGVLFVLGYCKRNHISALRLCDMIFPNILLAQAIGRWGNFFNQEAYGRVVSEAFYEHWPAFIKQNMLIGGSYREPTFFYESVANTIGFLLITLVYKKVSKPKRGDMVYAYLMWYGVVRLAVEQFRSDSLMFAGFKMAQIVSVIFFFVGLSGMLGAFRKAFKIKPIILFDFDGTIGDTEAVVLATFAKMFEKYFPNHPMSKDDEKAVFGPTLDEIFKHYQFPGSVDDLIQEYRDINFGLQEQMVKPMEGAIALLKELKQDGYKIGVVSNKLGDSVEMGLKLTGLEPYVDVVVGLEKVLEPKPDPQGIHKACAALGGKYDNCVYVGDHPNDILAGNNAQAYTIGFARSEEKRHDLEATNPNAIVEKLTEIATLLKEEHSWTHDLT